MTLEDLDADKRKIETTVDSLASDLAILSNLYQSELRDLDKGPPEEIVIWRESALLSLLQLKDVVEIHNSILAAPERAKIISLTAVFIGQDDFTDDRCRSVARFCLNKLGPLDKPTASHVLLDHLKPVFQTAMHPGVRQDTGRIKQNPLSVQNMYNEQSWKSNGIGCWNVLAWILSHVESESIESLWPLIIPPLLTIVDDYDPPYKIKGIVAVQALLEKASGPLLRRTGISDLLFKALQNALQNLTSDWSPRLLRSAMPCYLTLVDLVFPDDDMQRFNKLSELVTDTIVPGWLYASSKVDLMIASVEVLVPIIQTLGISSVRFLKAIVSQLTENLLPKEFSPVESTITLQVTSAKCLLVLMRNTRPRIPHWRHRILDAILRCWVDVVERSSNDELKSLLIELFEELLISSSDLLTNEISTLKDLNIRLFSDLLDVQKGHTLAC